MAFEKGTASRKIAIITIASLIAGYAISGNFIYRTAIGLDASAFPAGEWLQRTFGAGMSNAVAGLLLGLGSILAIVLIAVIYAAATDSGLGPDGTNSARRRFLRTSAAGGGALVAAIAGTLGNALFGLGKKGDGWLQQGEKIFSDKGVVKTDPVWKDAWKGARIESYGRLGRTDWAVSDTVLGAGRLRGDEAWKIVRTALDRGVNYIDTAPDYSATGSELAVGRALQDFPRDQVFLATKFCTPIGHLPAGTSVARYKEVIHDSLRRLETDYVDLIHIHSCDEVDRLMDENVHEAFDQLKAEGKARFLGVSTHTPRLVEVANTAIDSGRFDVMMLAYHHGIWPELAGIIDRAHDEQDMGIVAMKTLKGARHRNLEDFRDTNTYAQAALKWVHGNPNVSCAVISFFEMQHIDEYLYASGRRLGDDDVAVLERYDRAVAGSYCAPHCGVCLGSCPENVPINDVLRHRMYFEEYRSEKEAMDLYARLEINASACATCSAPCLGSCPLGIQIQERTKGAHALLSQA